MVPIFNSEKFASPCVLILQKKHAGTGLFIGGYNPKNFRRARNVGTNLMPEETFSLYELRHRRHNRELINKTSRLVDSDFIIRMLYKDMY